MFSVPENRDERKRRQSLTETFNEKVFEFFELTTEFKSIESRSHTKAAARQSKSVLLEFLGRGSDCGSVGRAFAFYKDILGSNPGIGKLYLPSSVLKSCVEMTKIKKKRTGKVPIKKEILGHLISI